MRIPPAELQCVVRSRCAASMLAMVAAKQQGALSRRVVLSFRGPGNQAVSSWRAARAFGAPCTFGALGLSCLRHAAASKTGTLVNAAPLRKAPVLPAATLLCEESSLPSLRDSQGGASHRGCGYAAPRECLRHLRHCGSAATLQLRFFTPCRRCNF